MKTYWYQDSFDGPSFCDSSERLEVGDSGPDSYANSLGCMTSVTPSLVTERRARWEEKKEVQHIIYAQEGSKSYLEY